MPCPYLHAWGLVLFNMKRADLQYCGLEAPLVLLVFKVSCLKPLQSCRSLCRTYSCKMPLQRLKIYPGVQTEMVVGVLRAYLSRTKAVCLAQTFKDLLSQHFKLCPRIQCMVHYSSLARDLIILAKNGVLGHACCKKALEEVL